MAANTLLAAVAGYWPCQDNAPNTVVLASRGSNATMYGGNTATKTTTGFGSGWDAGFALDGLGDYIALPPTVSGSDFTIHIAFRNGGSNNAEFSGIVSSSVGGGAGTWQVDCNGSGSLVFRRDMPTGVNTVLSAAESATWKWLTIRYDAAPRTITFFINGLQTDSFDPGVDLTITSLAVGRNRGNSIWWTGAVGPVVYDTALIDNASINDLVDGLEPTYTSGASIISNGGYNVGAWDTQGNGTITYEVAATLANGDVVDTATGATGTLDLSSAAGQLIYFLVRASNDGGYDVGDYATRTSAFGSADDGYYELASVTVPATGPVAYIDSVQSTADLSAYTFAGVPIGAAAVDRSLALAVHSRGANGGVLNSLTVDGVSASKIVGIANSTVGTSNSTNWYAIDKPTGDTSDIVATFASTQIRCQIDVYRLTDIDLATVAGTATSESRPAILSLPARPGGVVLAAGNVAQAGRTPTWAGVTEDATASLEGFFTASSASHIASAYEPSRTVTLDWDTTGVDFAAAAISLGGSLVRHFTRSPFTRSPLIGGGLI